MKSKFIKIFGGILKRGCPLLLIIVLALCSCKAFRLSTEKTEIEVETAHMAHLSIICADDTNLLV